MQLLAVLAASHGCDVLAACDTSSESAVLLKHIEVHEASLMTQTWPIPHLPRRVSGKGQRVVGDRPSGGLSAPPH